MTKGLVFAGSMIIGLLVIIIFGSPFGESPQKAYERGKVDGQLLVFEKWGHYSDKTVEQLVDCIHLRAIYVLDSLGSYYDSIDSTDTMPAIDSATKKEEW